MYTDVFRLIKLTFQLPFDLWFVGRDVDNQHVGTIPPRGNDDIILELGTAVATDDLIREPLGVVFVGEIVILHKPNTKV